MIKLSEETKQRALALDQLDSNQPLVNEISKSTEKDLDALIKYLHSDHDDRCSKKRKLADAMLRTSLLKDIEKTLKEQLQEAQYEEVKKSNKNKLKLWLLAIGGALFFACEGFDGMTSIFGLATVSGFISLGVALIFSVFSVMVFFGFGLKQISEHLEVKFKDAPEYVNEYVIELDEIEQILDTIDNLFKESTPLEKQLDEYTQLIIALKFRIADIQQIKLKLDVARNQTKVKLFKTGFSLLTGIIFFSSGFFTGQAVALTIAGLFMTVSATFPPILAASALIGLVSFLVYWYLERPGIENLIGRKMSLDDEKLDKLDSKRTYKINQRLDRSLSVANDKRALIDKEATNTHLTQELTATKQELIATKQKFHARTFPSSGASCKYVSKSVVPAQAGIHPQTDIDVQLEMDSRLRGNDNVFTRRTTSSDKSKRVEALSLISNRERLFNTKAKKPTMIVEDVTYTCSEC